jgi:hypothetical protein
VTGAGLVAAPARAGWLPRAWARAELAVGVAGVAFVAALLGRQFQAPGATMDEGAVLAYSSRVLRGAVPWRDFQTFYGPGNLWLVGAVSKVFGASVAAERAVGFGYRLAIVVALFLLARRFGRLAGILSIAVCAFLLPGQGVAALALYGSLAFALAGLVALTFAVAHPPGRARDLLSIAAGALLACGLLVRFDLVLAVALPAAVLLPLLSSRERRRVLVSFVVVALAYVPQLVLVGRAGLERLVRQLQATEPGRRLPFPSPRGYPGLILTPSIMATILLVGVGAVLVWRRRSDLQGRILLATGLLSAALLPTTLSRADDVHVIPGSVVSLALLPAVVTLLVQRMKAHPPERLVELAGYVTALALATGVVVIVVGAGYGALRMVVVPQPRDAYSVTVGGRSFPVRYAAEARDAQAIAHALDKLSEPGQSLFVGPADLRRSNYNDTYLYYLLPQLRSASFYMEMNPQTANRAGSGLARELRSADWLMLTNSYDNWSERNSSSRFGSTLPNRVVSQHFCRTAVHGSYVLLRRCR